MTVPRAPVSGFSHGALASLPAAPQRLGGRGAGEREIGVARLPGHRCGRRRLGATRPATRVASGLFSSRCNGIELVGKLQPPPATPSASQGGKRDRAP